MPKGGGGGNAGGGGGGFFRSLFTLALIALVGYNTYEIHALKSSALGAESRRSATKTPPPRVRPAPADTPSSTQLSATKDDLLRAAQNHIADAERYLHVKRYAEAQNELSAAARSFTRANAETKAQGEKILAQLRSATKALTMTGDDAASTSSPSAPPVKPPGHGRITDTP